MNEMTDFERAVLLKLLAGKLPLLEQLRSQIPLCRVTSREMTRSGFYLDLDVGQVPVNLDLTVRFGDVSANIEGLKYGAGFVLFVDHGCLTMLEGFSYEEPWPDTITAFQLSYHAGEERDLAVLSKAIEPQTEQNR
jgi:hypothetical protein